MSFPHPFGRFPFGQTRRLAPFGVRSGASQLQRQPRQRHALIDGQRTRDPVNEQAAASADAQQRPAMQPTCSTSGARAELDTAFAWCSAGLGIPRSGADTRLPCWGARGRAAQLRREHQGDRLARSFDSCRSLVGHGRRPRATRRSRMTAEFSEIQQEGSSLRGVL